VTNNHDPDEILVVVVDAVLHPLFGIRGRFSRISAWSKKMLNPDLYLLDITLLSSIVPPCRVSDAKIGKNKRPTSHKKSHHPKTQQ